jgi:hypothetical protein
MFPSHKTLDNNVVELETVIKRKLVDDSCGPEEFTKLLDQYTKLILATSASKQTVRVSPDVRATIIANLVGIGMIIHHERVNVIASKALSFVAKLK